MRQRHFEAAFSVGGVHGEYEEPVSRQAEVRMRENASLAVPLSEQCR
jgi:hypothetical protein